MADGDSIYAASIGTVEADLNVAGTLAAEVMAEATQNAVKSGQNRNNEKKPMLLTFTRKQHGFFLFYLFF